MVELLTASRRSSALGNSIRWTPIRLLDSINDFRIRPGDDRREVSYNRRCSQLLSSDRNYVSFSKLYMTFGVLRESFASENVLAFELLRGRWKTACGICNAVSSFQEFIQMKSYAIDVRKAHQHNDLMPQFNRHRRKIRGRNCSRNKIPPDHVIFPPHRNCPLSPVPDILTAKTVCLSSILTPDCGARDA
jgi:hypothetical protein